LRSSVGFKNFGDASLLIVGSGIIGVSPGFIGCCLGFSGAFAGFAGGNGIDGLGQCFSN